MIALPQPPSFRLDGRRALVVGASSGIGLGCAVALADAGAHVVMAARSQDTLVTAVAAVRDAGWSAEAMALDVTDSDRLQHYAREQEPFDVVVNSAGLARHSPALNTKVADYEAVMAANVRGAYFLATATAERMIAAGQGGSIITVSSQMGHVGGIDRAVYCASKHAVEGFTKAMAIEWGPHGIRINTICPTFVRTPLTEPTFADPDRVKWIEEKIKIGRVGEIEDVMGAVVFLASSASQLVTGSALMVDGGWTAD